MTSFRNYAAPTLAAWSLASPAPAQTVLTMSSWAPPAHHVTSVVLQGFADAVERASGGRLRFQMLPQHPIAAPGTFDAVRDGVVDVSFAVTSWTPDRHVLPLIAELPGGGETAETNSVAYSRVHWKYLQAAGEYKGVHLIGVFTHGAGQLFNTKRAIESVADLQGLKIRTGGGTAEAIARALGASPVVTTVPQDATEQLSSGGADGVFFPQEAVVSFKVERLVRYGTLFPGGLFNYAFGFFMNEDKWNRLPKEDQELITSFGGESLARRAGRSWDRSDRLGSEGMKRAGVRIDAASPALVEEIQARARPLVEAWINDVREKRNLDGAALLKEFREELKRVADGE
jgi:TRAP-type C4-dicarboxylate transport system substrate-binding protein